MIAVLLAGVALAGCAENVEDEEGDVEEATLGPDTFAVEVREFPEAVAAGETFTFQVFIAGDFAATSDHIGAHYGAESAEEPSTVVYPEACAHTQGDVPGIFEVECTVADVGEHFLRGHLRITEAGETFDYWSDELAFVAEEVENVAEDPPANETQEPPANETQEPALTAESFTLTTEGVPTNVAVGEPFTFTLEIAGEPEVTSDHIGAHYGANSTMEPSTAVYTKACEHTPGTVPGTFEVTCTFAEAGTHFLRGHLRVTEDGEQFDYWSDEHAIEAA